MSDVAPSRLCGDHASVAGPDGTSFGAGNAPDTASCSALCVMAESATRLNVLPGRRRHQWQTPTHAASNEPRSAPKPARASEQRSGYLAVAKPYCQRIG